MGAGPLEAQLKGVIDAYRDHPTFLHWAGKPVFFFWRPDAYGDAPAWVALRNRLDPNREQIWSVDTVDKAQDFYLDAFDTLHLFSAAKWDANTDLTRVNAEFRGYVDDYNRRHGTQRLWTAGVLPGWDESRVLPPRPTPKVFPRQDGALYETSWQGAIASNPDWITITSYNEWFEGTQIEPGESYGNQYLDLTRQWVQQYKK
jgi:hypothetical protein